MFSFLPAGEPPVPDGFVGVFDTKLPGDGVLIHVPPSADVEEPDNRGFRPRKENMVLGRLLSSTVVLSLSISSDLAWFG